MQGIAAHYTLPQAAVMSVEAGDDLLEGAFDASSMQGMLQALHAAINAGAISRARIDQSARRILTLKARFGLIPVLDPHANPPDVFSGAAGLLAQADLPHNA